MSLFPSAHHIHHQPQQQQPEEQQPAWTSIGSSYEGQALAVYAPPVEEQRAVEEEKEKERESKDKKRKKEKKEKHSKKARKHKKHKKTSRERHKLLEDGRATAEMQPYLLEYRSGSSDFESSSDDEQLSMIHVPANKEVVFMPNGQMVLAGRPHETKQYVLDKRGDRDTLTSEGFYRKDIPDYVLQTLPTHGRASKAVSLQRIVALTSVLQPIQDQPSVPFSKRYFGGQAVSGNTSVNVRRWRIPELKQIKAARAAARQRAQTSAGRSEGAGSIFRIETGSDDEDDEFAAARARMRSQTSMVPYSGPAVEAGAFIPLDPKGMYGDSGVHHKAFKTDAECAQALAMQLTKEFNERTREHPEDLDAWLAYARSQDKITRLQRGNTGALSAWSRVVVEKSIAVMESAKKYHPDNANLYLHWIRLALAFQSHEQVQRLWSDALLSCPMSAELRCLKPVAQRMHFPSFTVASARTTYAADIWGVNRSLTTQRMARSARTSTEQRRHEDAEAESLIIDMLHGLLLAEQAAGHRERAVALVQAFLELNLNRPTSLVAETTWETLYRRFSDFWEADTPRIGDIALAESTNVGWRNWSPEAAVAIAPTVMSTAASAILQASKILERPPPPGDEASHDHRHHQLHADNQEQPMMIATAELEPAPQHPPPPPPAPHNDDAQPTSRPPGRKRRMKAADYFRDVLEPEHEKALKRQGLDVTEEELEKAEDAAPQVSAVADDGTVYSVVHGYRIKVADSDTSLPYRKMLAELRQEKGYAGEDIAHMSVEEILALSKKDRSTESIPQVPADDSYARWAAAESYVSQLQWNVVNALADEQAAEEQPERAVLFDDIKATLFPVHTEAGVARLLFRLLQSLGVHFGLVGPAFETVHRMQPLNCEDVASTLLAKQVGNAFNAVLGTGAATRRQPGPIDETELDGLQVLSSVDMLATAPAQMTERHRESVQIGRPSLLQFVIQCVATAVKNDSNKLSLRLRCQWAAACMLLLAQARGALTVDLQVEAAGATGTRDDDAAVRTSARMLLSTCEEMLAGAQGQSLSPHELTELRTVLYGAYIQVECVLSASKDALKICDKTLQTLQTAGSITPIASLCWLALRLMLQLPVGCAPAQGAAVAGLGSEQLVSSQLQSNLEGCLQNAFYLVQACKQGRYTPVLSKKRKTPDLAAAGMRGILHTLAEEEGEALQRFVEHVRNVAKQALPSNVTDCSLLDATPTCVHLCATRAWLTYLLELAELRAQGTAPLLLETALATADQVLAQGISMLQGVLQEGHPLWQYTATPDIPSLSPQSELMFGKAEGVDNPTHHSVLNAAEVQCVVGLQRLHRWRLELHIAHWKAFGGSATYVRRLLHDAVSHFPGDAGFLSLLMLVETRHPGGAISCRNLFSALESRLAWGGGLTPLERIVVLAHECFRVRVQLEQEHENISDTEAATAQQSKRLRSLFEKLLEDPVARGMPIIWRCYLRFEVKQKLYENAKRLFYRAIQSCSWCKELWMDAFRRDVLRPAFSPTEVADIRDIMDEKGVYIRIESVEGL